MQKIGVIGAGLMGTGIAQTIAQSGMTVVLADIDIAIAEKAKARIDKTLDRLVEKGRIAPDAAAGALSRIVPASGYDGMADAALIIEAATEREEIKRSIFASVGEILGADAILASNTSSIPITRMAAASPDPARFIGMHFFNPVPLMKLVEVIPGLATAENTVDRVRDFAERIGKTVVRSGDAPAFIVNRVLCPMLNEAIFVLGDGTGSVVDIDQGCKLGLNHPMGPLELSDFVGLDTLLEVMKVLHETTGEDKYRPAPLLRKYVEAGWTGKKSGRGFYDYSGDTPVPTR